MLATVYFWSLEQRPDRRWGKAFPTPFPLLHGREWLAAGDCAWEGEHPCLQHGVPRPARISCTAVRLDGKRQRKRAPSNSNITAYQRQRASDGKVDRKAYKKAIGVTIPPGAAGIKLYAV